MDTAHMMDGVLCRPNEPTVESFAGCLRDAACIRNGTASPILYTVQALRGVLLIAC